MRDSRVVRLSASASTQLLIRARYSIISAAVMAGGPLSTAAGSGSRAASVSGATSSTRRVTPPIRTSSRTSRAASLTRRPSTIRPRRLPRSSTRSTPPS